MHDTPSLVELLPVGQPSLAAKSLERKDSSLSSSPTANANSTESDIGVKFEVGFLDFTDLTKDKKDKLSFSKIDSDRDMGVFDLTKTHLYKFREASPLPVVEEPKNYDRYVVKRVQSASFVEVPRVGMLKQGGCRCMSESQGWRERSVSISGRTTNNWRSNSRVRLISDSNLQNSLLRLQSHHSSSEEDWFEEISNDDENCDDSLKLKNNSKNKLIEIVKSEKVPVIQDIPFDEPYQPVQSMEDITLGHEVAKSGMNSKCCFFQCSRKRKLRKVLRKRNSFKSNISENTDSVESLHQKNSRCCIIL